MLRLEQMPYIVDAALKMDLQDPAVTTQVLSAFCTLRSQLPFDALLFPVSWPT